MRTLALTIGILLSFTTIMAQSSPQDAMQVAIEKLQQAQKDGDERAESTALCDVATLNLRSSLDAEAEEYASRAETIARREGYHDILSRALIIKANICAYAETDSLFNRNDEGLRYALEALQEAEVSSSEQLVLESCCSISQLYVNKNRWNKKLKDEWYRLAGEYLDRAELLSKTTPPENKAKIIAFRMRYFRQGKEIEKAIEYCETAFGACTEDDFSLKAQLCDQLTPLYIENGDYAAAADAHSACVHYATLYNRASEAEKLQELQGKYELELKQTQIERKTYQILFLSVFAILLTILAVLLHLRNRREKQLRIEAQQESMAKQELIEFISKDMKNPVNSGMSDIEDFASKAVKMSEEEIESEAKRLIEENRHLSRDVAEYVSDIIISRKKKASDFGLTEREMEIIRLSIEGLKASEIAERLFISTRTVSNHKANIYSKMGVRTNGEMCRKARETGLI